MMLIVVCVCYFRVYALDENIVLWWFFVSSVISRAFIYFTLLFVHKTVIYRIFYYAQSILFENCEAQEKKNNFLQLNIIVFNVSILFLKHSTHKFSAVLFCLHEKCRIKEISILFDFLLFWPIRFNIFIITMIIRLLLCVCQGVIFFFFPFCFVSNNLNFRTISI